MLPEIWIRIVSWMAIGSNFNRERLPENITPLSSNDGSLFNIYAILAYPSYVVTIS